MIFETRVECDVAAAAVATADAHKFFDRRCHIRVLMNVRIVLHVGVMGCYEADDGREELGAGKTVYAEKMRWWWWWWWWW